MNHRRNSSSARIYTALEPRMLFSSSPLAALIGDCGPACDDGMQLGAFHHQVELSMEAAPEITADFMVDPSQETQTRSEIVFVDRHVDDFASLVESIRQQSSEDEVSFHVIMLPSDSDGIAAISAALAQRTDVSAIHIVSHGEAGGVQLGNTWLTTDSLSAYAGDLAEWGSALGHDADLLFYGCQLAASNDGQLLIETIAELTGADVAASDDLTGHTSRGGDWKLEYETGEIETEIAFSLDAQADWEHLLNVAVDATSTGTSGGGDFSVSHTTAGSERLMVVGVSMNLAGANQVDSINYNGDALSLVGTRTDGDARVEIWSLVNPDIGTYNVDIAFNSPSDGATAGVMTFDGVDQTTPLGAFASGSGVGGSGSATVTSAAGELVFGTIAVDDPVDYDLIPGAGQTETWDLLGGGQISGGGSTEAGAASVDMDWTWSGSDNWAVGGVSIKPSSAALWLTTDGAASGTPGLGSWAGGDVVQFGDPNLSFEPGTTDGTFSGIVNFDSFLAGAKPDALHYVTREITVGVTTKITLYEGDLLFSTVSDGTLTSSNSLLVQDEDLIIYRPDTPGDYSSGLFSTLIDYTDINTGDRMAYTLVEQDTWIGDALVQGGAFLYTKNNTPDIYQLVLDEVGDTTSATTNAVLIEGQDIGLGASDFFDGMELIESNTTIGGTTLNSGRILVSLNVDGNVGDTPIAVKHQDVFLLDVSTTGATTSAAATMFMEGLDIQLDDLAGASENITGLTLVGQSLTANPPLVVDTTEDYTNLDVKYGDTSSILGLLADKGSDGLISLREAIDAANNTANFDASTPDEIYFNVSTADAGYADPDAIPANGDEYWTILVDASGLPYLLDPVILDATTQPGYDSLTGRPVIELDGSLTPAASGINGIALRTNDSIVKGFVVHSFADEGMEIDGSTGFGDNNTFQNNWVGIDAEGNLAANAEHAVMISVDASGNQIGGTGDHDGNVIVGAPAGYSGVVIQSNSDNNTVQGNNIGVMPDGITAAPNGDNGITILTSSDNNLIGGTAPGAGNVISGNTEDGILIDGTTNGTYTTVITGTLVQGNFIGTDATGTILVANGDDGIDIKNGATNNIIGGNTASHRNIISGNTADGIYLESAGNTAIGNYIGTDVTGTINLGNGNSGVRAWNAGGSNAIGSVNPGEGNLIAFNNSDGVEIHGTTTGVSILGNSIYRNVGLGIDLGSNGVTANDGGDADSGVNDLQNTAVFTMVSHSLGTTTVNFDLDWAGLAKNYRIEFFVSQLADHSGSGEGETLVHSQVISHTGSGNESFMAAFATSDTAVITATVTEDFGGSYGNTSEFSAVRNARGGQVLVVDTNSDIKDGITTSVDNLLANKGADGFISLREAIEATNATIGTFDIIQFEIAPGGIQTIVLTGVYQNITDAGILDATTQYGYAGAPLIELDGSATTGATNGITLAASAAGSTVRGFIVHSFADDGIEVIGDNNIVQNNWVGLNSAGAADPNGGDGIILAFAASGNLIGGAGINEGNVVSGNTGGGITLRDAGTDGNFVYGNLIGVAADGVTMRANGADGVWISTDVANNLIGGTAPGQTNVISGNTASGILVSAAGVNNVIAGNYIGTDETGLIGVGNLGHGIEIVDSASTVVGGNTANHRNVISGNTVSGVSLWGATTTLNTIQGNYIGTDITGTVDLGNLQNGVLIDGGANNNEIGDGTATGRNVISGNDAQGVYITGDSTDNRVRDNLIGTDLSGTADLGNTGNGIAVNGGSNNTIIGGIGAGNLISGNDGNGLFASGVTGLVIQGNFVGTNAAGSAAIGNVTNGLNLAVSGAQIGGTNAGEGNVISGNTGEGVEIQAAGTANRVEGNIIGLDATGTTIIGNTGHGVYIYSSANGNFVGGTAAGARNIISGNNVGVYISGIGSDANVIEGNYIGTDFTGTLDRGNTASGVRISAGANNTIGGTTAAARNIISGNDGSGVLISALSATGNLVQGNYIGTDVSGTLDLGNNQQGVWVSAPSNTIDGNLISGNDGYGIYVSGAAATGTIITGNLIGTNAAGTAALLNGDHAIYLNGVDSTTIGGNTAAARNVINAAAGKYGLYAFSATSTTIQGNYVGTDVAGTTALAGGTFAVNIVDSGNTVIGGSVAAEANVIAGYSVTGINVSGAASSGTQIAGNFVGTDTSGTLDLTPGIYGITLQLSAAGILVGGALPGQGNTIAFHDTNGVRLFSGAGTGNSIRRNRIYSNGGIGIDLEGDDISANDAGDGDSGPNDVLNFPVIYNAVFSGPNVIITGEARPGATVEFFKVANDGDTHGEAAEYLGSGVVTGPTPGIDDPTARQFSFAFSIGSLIDTDSITATATDAVNNTSEFAANVAINNAPVLDNLGDMNLTDVLQNTVDPVGDQASAIIASAGGNRITDPDLGAVEGMAVTAVDNANGTWEYSTNGGSSWTAFGLVTNASAVVLGDTANDMVRFVPNTNFFGNATITFRAWDTSDGNASGATGVDTSINGSSTAFSTATETADVYVEPAEVKLILSTTDDVGPKYSKPDGGVPGLPSWSEGSIISMRDNGSLSFGETTTSGVFNALYNFDKFAADADVDIRGLHFVTKSITVTGGGISGGSVNLLAGDVIFVTEVAETLSNAATGVPAGWANNIVTNGGDVYVFRAENIDDYSSGFFRQIISAPGAPTQAITLVEQATLIGGTVVAAGDFLFSDTANNNDIYWYDTGLDASNQLVEGSDVFIGDGILGLELVETGATVGGVSLSTGTILVTLDNDDSTVGNNLLATTKNDIFALDFAATTFGSGTAVANAQLFFDGDGNVRFDSVDENLDALSLIILGTGGNVAPSLGNSGPAESYTEDATPTIIDTTITVVDGDSPDFATGLLTVEITAGGATGDRLSIFNNGTGPGQIGVSGNDVTYGGTSIGTFTGGRNSGDPLVINLNANADVVATQALMRSITFWNTSDNPATAARTIEFVLSDGDGGVSNAISQSVSVVTVADAPVAVHDSFGLDFDGIDDYVGIADSPSLTMTGTVTMEVWIRPDASTNVNRMIINKEGEYEVALFSDDQIYWAFDNTDPDWSWHGTGYTVTNGVWTHIAVSYDSGTVSTYVNGTMVDVYYGSGTIGDAHATLDELRIGGRSNNPSGKFFDGMIDDVRVWNSARTQLEIQTNLDVALTGAEAGLAGLWTFNEGGGTTASDLANGNVGSLIDGGAGTAGPQWTGFTTDQDTTLNVAVAGGALANDLDPDADPLTVTEINGVAADVGTSITLSSGANVTLNSDGSFDYDPNGAFDSLAVGDTAVDSFDYTIDDGTGRTDTATVSIIITGLNDAPVESSIEATNLAYSEDDGPTQITSAIAIADVDDSNIESATIQITGNYASGQDVLAFTNTGTITGLWNAVTGTMTLTGTDTLANYEAALRSITYDNTSDDPTTLVRTVSFTINDGSLNSNTLTRDVDVTPVNDAPVEATIEGTALAYTENDPATTITSTLTITDIDDTNLESATIQITGNYAAGEDVLAFTNTGTITGVWNAVSGTMTLTGSDTLANYEAALRSVTYQNTSENPQTLTRTVTFIVNDGDNNSNIQTRQITIASINDDPTNPGSLPSDISVIEETASDVDLSLINLADLDAGTSSLTVTLSTSAGGLLTASTGGSVTVVGSGTTAITLTGNVTDLNTFLDTVSNVQYTGPTGLVGNDVDTIDVDVTDNGNTGAGGGGTIALGTVNVDITNINDAPVTATIEGTALAYTENDPATAITSTLTITDIDDTNLESATIQITGNYAAGEDVLAFTNTGTITGVWNAVSGTMTLTGTDTLANYEAALRSVTYQNTSENPQTLTRTVTFIVNDGDNNSNIQTRQITIASINDDPTNPGSLPSDISVIEETASDVDLSLLNLADLDAGTSSLTVTLSTSTGGLLTASTGGGVTVVGSGTTTITLTGNVTDLNTFLDTVSNVQYTGPTDLIGNDVDTIDVDLTDNGNTGAGGGATIALGTVNVDITNINDAPVITSDGGAATAAISVAENTTAITTMTATDVDLPADTLTFSITGGADAGDFAINSGTGVLTFISGKNFEAPDDSNGDGVYEIQVTVDDGNSGTDIQSVSVTITDVNEVPIITSDGGGGTANLNVAENTTTVTTVMATDPDLPPNVLNFMITGGADSLEFVINSSTGQLTFISGKDYESPSDANSDGIYEVQVTVDDGNGGNDVQTINVNITDVNEAPVAVVDNYSVNEGATLNITPSGVLANDFDADGDALTAIPISGPSHGTLALNLDGSFTYTHDGSETTTDSFTYLVSDGNGGTDTAVVNLTVNPVNDLPVAATDAFTVDEGATLTVTPTGVLANDSDGDGDSLDATLITGPTQGTLTLNLDGSFVYTHNGSETTADSFIYQVDDGNGGLATAVVTISVTPVNDAPTIISSLTETTPEDVPLTFSTANGNPITVADADAATGLLVVTLDSTNGTISLASTVNLTFATGTGVDDASMEFAGTVSDINAALDGLTFLPSPNFHGSATMDLVVDDQGNVGTGGDLTDSTRIDISVTPVNDAPTAADDAFTLTPGQPTLVIPTSALLINDADVDGEPLVALIATPPVHGNVVVAADGSIIYAPLAGFVGSDSFTYWARDVAGAGDLATVTVNVVSIAAPSTTTGGLNTTTDAADDPGSDPLTPAVTVVPISVPVPSNATNFSGATNPTSDQTVANVRDQWDGQGELKGLRLAELEASGLVATDLVGERVDNDVQQVVDLAANATAGPLYTLSESFLSELKHLADDIQLAEELRATIGLSLGVAGTAASIGYLIWTIRSGFVFASMLASTPVWSRIDPLPVIDFRAAGKIERRRPNQGDGDSLVDAIGREFRMAT